MKQLLMEMEPRLKICFLLVFIAGLLIALGFWAIGGHLLACLLLFLGLDILVITFIFAINYFD